VIGEGGSGGALAIGVCDSLLMLQYSTYSVISPEGCARPFCGKRRRKAPDAAEAMGLTAERLKELGFVDELVKEPLGGAHRDMDTMADSLRKSIDSSAQEIAGAGCSAASAQASVRAADELRGGVSFMG
jgi:acetyl-CoA carboxylase carboxyl transferase subunit alpha